MKKTRLGTFLFLLGAVSVMAANPHETYPYRTAAKEWPESLGNHRAVIEANAAEAVRLNFRWRRPDADPQEHRFLILNARTGDTIPYIERINVNNEACELVFGPVKSKDTYHFYYLPYQVQTGHGFYHRGYLPKEETAPREWSARTHSPKLPSAKIKAVESRTDFDSFYPMEVASDSAEIAAYLEKNVADFWVFAEDRSNPIRMREKLPLKWISGKQEERFTGKAQRNEYYTFQIGVFGAERELKNVRAVFSDLKSASNRIPAANLTCFNQEGVNASGMKFTKRIDVRPGHVQPLWIGVDIAPDIRAGRYEGTVTVEADGVRAETIPVTIEVRPEFLTDRGDSETWRHSRLRWLNSTRGIHANNIAPYQPVGRKEHLLSCSGRTVRVDKLSALPKQITASNTKILNEEIRFVIETEEGVKELEGSPEYVSQTSGRVTWRWNGADATVKVSCEAMMEFDGWMNYKYTITPLTDITVTDIRLEIPLRKEIATTMTGMGLPGQSTPSFYKGQWDTPEKSIDQFGVSIPVSEKANWLWPFDSFWIGNTKGGIHCELRGSGYTGPLLNLYRPGYPASWFNEGKGGFIIEQQEKKTTATVYSGERELKKGNDISFDFAFIVTPVKPLNIQSQFTDRYYHNGGKPVPTQEDFDAGVKMINVHHANEYNPFINYPFLTADRMKELSDKWHTDGCKMKIYYTIRELTNATTEIWALRSLGEEILRGGNGGGYPWLREHLVSDYTPQWYQHFETPEKGIMADASILTSTGDSRWFNYYIEGLAWLIENAGIDGLYMDDVSFGRDMLKRMRTVMNEVKPGCIMDLHSNTGFSKGPVNQYMEFFPYIDKLWLGESFIYNQMEPENWLVESSGIPFGLMGDMLHAGGNKWLGMQYGMTVRHPWTTEGVTCDPRPVWKIWDEFGIANASMLGFWETVPAVTATDSDVKVTAYVKEGVALLSLGNYTDEEKEVTLNIDWKQFPGINKTGAILTFPEIPDFQEAQSLSPDAPIRVTPRQGYLIYLKNH